MPGRGAAGLRLQLPRVQPTTQLPVRRDHGGRRRPAHRRCRRAPEPRSQAPRDRRRAPGQRRDRDARRGQAVALARPARTCSPPSSRLPLSSTHRLVRRGVGSAAPSTSTSRSSRRPRRWSPRTSIPPAASWSTRSSLTPPISTAVAAALPGATITWIDGDARPGHLAREGAGVDLAARDASRPRATRTSTPASPSRSVGIARQRDPPGDRAGGAERRGHRRSTPSSSTPATSNSSLAFHLGAVTEMTPTGWQAQADGSLLGTPDQSAVSRAAAAGIPIWPSLANDPDPTGDRSAPQQPQGGRRAHQRDARGDQVRRLHGHQRRLRGDARRGQGPVHGVRPAARDGAARPRRQAHRRHRSARFRRA